MTQVTLAPFRVPVTVELVTRNTAWQSDTRYRHTAGEGYRLCVAVQSNYSFVASRDTAAPSFSKLMQAMNRYTRSTGFTLVELLIVLALIGIVASIAIRSVSGTIRMRRPSAKATAIVSTDIEQAFALAARQRTPMRPAQFPATVARTFAVVERADTTLKYRTRQFVSGDLALDYISVSSRTIRASCPPDSRQTR